MITNEKNWINNPHRPQIPDYLYRILIIEKSGSGKTNVLTVIKYFKDSKNFIESYKSCKRVLSQYGWLSSKLKI